MDKKTAGRPFKMKIWVETLQEVLENENILFLSEHDLLFLVNDKLEDNQKITKRTFQNWKSGEFHESPEIGQIFMKCIERAIIKQKQYLEKRFINDDKNWQRYAWILERKWSDWNLKKISERINRNENTNIIQITAGNEKQRQLIDNIINADFVEIPIRKLEIKPADNKKDDEYEF